MKRTLVVAVLLLAPNQMNAHAVVTPSTSRPGAYERYVLRVPNESDNPTTRIEITFPAEVRVISFLDVPGWRLEARMDTASGRALSATWTGSLPPERFVELPFIGVNPASSARITWPVVQLYANGNRVEWTGAPESDNPASVTVIESSAAWRSTPWPGVAALVVALLALALAVRRRGGAAMGSAT